MNDDSQYLLSNFRKDDDSRYRLSNFKKKKKSDEDGILSSIGSGAKRFGKNIGIGISELGRNLANTPHNLANLIGQGDNVANLVDPEFDYAKAFGMDEEATLGDKLTRGLSQYGPAFALPGVGLGRAGGQ